MSFLVVLLYFMHNLIISNVYEMYSTSMTDRVVRIINLTLASALTPRPDARMDPALGRDAQPHQLLLPPSPSPSM